MNSTCNANLRHATACLEAAITLDNKVIIAESVAIIKSSAYEVNTLFAKVTKALSDLNDLATENATLRDTISAHNKNESTPLKTIFVKLSDLAVSRRNEGVAWRIATIKEIRELTNWSLSYSKDFTEYLECVYSKDNSNNHSVAIQVYPCDISKVKNELSYIAIVDFSLVKCVVVHRSLRDAYRR